MIRPPPRGLCQTGTRGGRAERVPRSGASRQKIFLLQLAHIQKTLVLSELARMCKFAPKRSFLLDRALRSRWRLCRLRMRRTPCG